MEGNVSMKSDEQNMEEKHGLDKKREENGICTDKSNRCTVRVLMQQCLSAELQVKPSTNETEAEYVKIGCGAVVYLCLLHGATSTTVRKLAKLVVDIRLSENAEGKLVSLLTLPGDVLIVPQATLGGRAKGNMMQYHGNIDKTTGEQLYQEFVQRVVEAVQQNIASVEKKCVVKSGTYGNRQVLKMDTNGPFSHVIEL